MTDYSLERGLPASEDAERSILGAVLLDNGAMYDAAWAVTAEQFSLDSHRRIFASMREMFDHSMPIDIITLSNYMRDKSQLEAVGGVAYLASLTDGVPPRANIEHYVRIVVEKAQLRGLYVAIQRASGMVLEGGYKPADCIALLQECILDIGQTGKQSRHILELMNDAVVEIDRLRKIETITLGATLDFKPLDDVTTGIRNDELWVIGARPNVGKTPFGMQIALANARQETNVEVLSLEMSDLQLAFRCLIHAGAADPWKLRDPRRMTPDDRQQVLNGASRIGELPLWVCDAGSMTLPELRNRIRYAVRRRGVRLFVLDYLQLVEVPGTRNAYEAVSATAKGLRALVRETKVPIVALSQLNRNAKDPSQPPNLADLRESGVIEQEANVVVLIHRPEITDEESPEKGQMAMEGEFILAKVREGVKGPEPFNFDDLTLTFQPK